MRRVIVGVLILVPLVAGFCYTERARFRLFRAAPAAPPRPPGGPPPAFQPAAPPLFTVLDLNHDGELDGGEIAKAAVTLKPLDKNGDGKLNATELGWPPPFPGFFAGFGPPAGPARTAGPGGLFGGPPMAWQRGGQALAQPLLKGDEAPDQEDVEQSPEPAGEAATPQNRQRSGK